MAKATRLPVRESRVPCPNRGNINLDICLYCEHLTAVDLDRRDAPAIECVPPPVDHPRPDLERTPPTVRPKPHKPHTRTGEAPLDPKTMHRLLEQSLKHPEWGGTRLTAEMHGEGLTVSRRKVGRLLELVGLAHVSDRVRRLAQVVTAGEIEPDEQQLSTLVRHDPCFAEWRPGGRPGRHLLLASRPVFVSDRGIPVHAHIAIDSYSAYTFALLSPGSGSIGSVLLIQYKVLPYFAKLGICIEHISASPHLLVQTAGGTHSLAEFLRHVGVAFEADQSGPAYFQRFQHEFWKPFAKRLQELPPPSDLAEMQECLDLALADFHHQHLSPGYPLLNCTPQQRIDNYCCSE